MQTTEDYDFALELINKIPDKLIGGTDSIAKIGRIKNKKEELSQLLIKSQNERLKNKNNLEKLKNEDIKFGAIKFLRNEIKKAEKNGEEFNLTKWKNEDGRSQSEIDAAEELIKDQQFNGGNSDNWEVIKEIETLLDEEKFLEADKRVSEALQNDEIRKSTYTTYKETTIPNARDLKGNTFFEIPYIKETLDTWTGLITKGSAGDAAKAVLAETYLKKHLKQWLKDNKDLEKYIGKSSELENDFIAEFDKHIVKLRETGEFDMLFGKGVAIKDDKTALETLEDKIKKVEDNETKKTQQIVDFSTMSDFAFENKYGVSREKFAEDNGLTYTKIKKKKEDEVTEKKGTDYSKYETSELENILAQLKKGRKTKFNKAKIKSIEAELNSRK